MSAKCGAQLAAIGFIRPLGGDLCAWRLREGAQVRRRASARGASRGPDASHSGQSLGG